MNDCRFGVSPVIYPDPALTRACFDFSKTNIKVCALIRSNTVSPYISAAGSTTFRSEFYLLFDWFICSHSS